MLFLVVSQPVPVAPSTVRELRQAYFEWAEPLLESGTLRDVHARVGRGAVATFEVASNDELHLRLTEWSEIIPAEFTVYPLVDRATMAQHLADPAGGS